MPAGRNTRRPFPMALFLTSALLLLGATGLSGCTAIKVAKIIKNADTTVSITVEGEDARLATLADELNTGFGVEATVQAVRAGATVLRIAGAYKAVLDCTRWMLEQGLAVLANDKSAELILHVAVAFLK